jgi:type VI protein secretion system component Hcp
MKKIIFLLMIIPASLYCQKNDSYGKFIDPDGAIIKGSSVTAQYERQIIILELKTNPTSKNTSVRFKMPTGNASAVFRNAMNNQRRLQKGEIVVVALDGDRKFVESKINMENMEVKSCNDTAISETEIEINATRIGWTYYTNTKRGTIVESKTGWDNGANAEWKDF